MSDSLWTHELQPGFSVHHYLPEFAQTHIHWVSDAIQPSHPLLPPPLALNFSQHQGLFQWVSQFFTSDGESVGSSTSASVLPMNIQGWFPLGLTGLISLQSKGLSRVFSSTTVWKLFILQCSAFFMVQHSSVHDYWENIALTRWTFVGKVMTLLFTMLSRLVITSLPRSKHLFISWLQSPSAVTLEPKKIVSHCFHCFPIYLPWRDGTGCHDLCFLNVEC